MELERRVGRLERDVDVLKGEIEQTLLDVRENLSEKLDSPSRWHRRAWIVALLNVLLALTLFTNVRFYTLSPPLDISPILVSWMRAFWVILAFLWLILQMYPLALLLNQEERRTREAVWHNATGLFASITLALTLAVLVVVVISMLFPSLWFVVMVVSLVVVCANGVLSLLRLHRQQTPAKE